MSNPSSTLDFLKHQGIDSVISTEPDEYDSFLAQYGIPGMQWGRRRTEAQLAKAALSKDGKPLHGAALKARKEKLGIPDRKTGQKSNEGATAEKLRVQAKTEGLATLSNAQLKELNARNKLEKEFKDWQANQPLSKRDERVKKAQAFALQLAADRLGAEIANNGKLDFFQTFKKIDERSKKMGEKARRKAEEQERKDAAARAMDDARRAEQKREKARARQAARDARERRAAAKRAARAGTPPPPPRPPGPRTAPTVGRGNNTRYDITSF